MLFFVRITHTTGKVIEERSYLEWLPAHQYFQRIVASPPYQRVLVLLLRQHGTDPDEILDLEFIDEVFFQRRGSSRYRDESSG